jgi:hypothetical protein
MHRAPSMMRATESSARAAIARSWTRNRSAICARFRNACSLSIAIGSSLTLPLVMTCTRGPELGQEELERARGRNTPISSSPGATFRAIQLPRSGTSTIGAQGETIAPTAATLGTAMRIRSFDRVAQDRERLCGRRLRVRSFANRPRFAASHARRESADALERERWRRPRVASAADQSALAERAPVTVDQAERGPQSGHATGSAWKRRS